MLEPPFGTTGFSPFPVARIINLGRPVIVMIPHPRLRWSFPLVYPKHREVEMRSPLRWPSAALAWSVGLMLCCASLLPAQGTGTVRGTVTDAVTRRPVDGAQVYVVGSDFATLTNSLGEFQLVVPADELELRARRVGYGTTSKKATITAGDVTTVDSFLSVVDTLDMELSCHESCRFHVHVLAPG